MHWLASQTLAQIICGKPLKLEDQEWRSKMGPELAAAQRTLATAISEGKLHAFGRKTQQGKLEDLPADTFRIRGITVVISPHGEVVSLRPHQAYSGEQWHSIEFDAAEVKHIFPSPPRQSVEQWMIQTAEEYACKGQIGKRDVMVKECQRATGCVRREAEAAHARLPEKFRRGRGKPSKRAG